MQLVSGVELEKQLWSDWMSYKTKYYLREMTYSFYKSVVSPLYKS